MTQHLQTWRDLLGGLDGEEKRRIITALGIQEKTWERWMRGTTTLPHLARIRQLLTVLPVSTRTQFLACLARDPKFAKYGADHLLSEKRQAISSTLYEHILEANVVTPEPLRFMTLCQLILLEMVGHLDPDQFGLSVAILTCTPPGPDHPVRTLSQRLSLGTPPWSKVLESQRYFLGAESLAGRAVMTRRPCVVQTLGHREDAPLLSLYQDEHASSGAAVPIQKQGRCAGCFLVVSTQPNFFPVHHVTLIQRYCELMAIALRDEEWYSPEQLVLRVMPSASTQHAYLARYLDRVSMLCKHHPDGPLAHWLEAEQVVRQQIEAELVAQE